MKVKNNYDLEWFNDDYDLLASYFPYRPIFLSPYYPNPHLLL
jgi:hypothetical protein